AAAVAGIWPDPRQAGGGAAGPARRRRAGGRAVPAGPRHGPVRRDQGLEQALAGLVTVLVPELLAIPGSP
ncbi:MAG TPA: hypothetical protein VJ347_22315, partial [Streptosporangiaceae bacterium]|nr:hypothetical protein [Streptosporangiaceae bacterium]